METAAERLSEMGNWLQAQEFLSVTEACKRADASPATIRRDFAQLVAQGVAERHRGGVRRSRRDALSMVPFAVREMRMAAEKSAIAAAAAKLIEPGDVVFVDGGTSTLHLAEHLGRVPVRVITNSLRLAVALGERSYEQPVEMHISGGYLLPRSGLLVGPQAREGIARYHARWAFLSVGGIGTDGVWNTDELVAEIEQGMIANADRVVVLADRSKLGARSLLHVAALSKVHLLITDGDGPAVEELRAAGCDVRTVAVPG
jgi:DeoR/GlpR family transcriptional regulator of sugar metabolism